MLAAKKRQPLSPLGKREAIDGYLGILPWFIGFLLFTLIPLGTALYLSFCHWDILTPIRWAGLANYKNILKDAKVLSSMWNTFRYLIAVVPLTTALGLLIALILNQNIKGILGFRIIFYLPAVLPGVSVALLWVWMLNPDFGIVNTLLNMLGIPGPGWLTDKKWAMWGIILRQCWGVGGGMILFLAALQSVPASYYEAARIDGANLFQRFFSITLPMISSTVFYFIITGIIGALQEFTIFRVMTNGGPSRSTTTFVLYLYDTAFTSYTMGYASAMAWVLFIVSLILTGLMFKTSNWVYYESENGR